jgi:nitrate/nitrite transporter NarK
VNEQHTLWAFMATLLAIVILYGIGAVLAFQGKPMEALGIGGAGTGLIGVLGTFKPRTPTANVEQADTVNQGKVA